ncbi:MAG: hypothetical protein GXP37_05650 [Chloroflexi bacterium]|nr:hypothetical protein [Chloroflexota bacterium]
MPPHKTVFTTDRGRRHQQDALAAAPPELDVVMLRRPDRHTLQQALANAEYLISERTGTIDAELLRAAPGLKLILRLGSLTHDIDTAAAHSAGILVCRWPVASVIRVAEHVMMQMLALGKHLGRVQTIARTAESRWGPSRRTDEDTFAFNWSRQSDLQCLWRRSIGIIGFGEIGAELARRLQGWDADVLYNKRRRLPAATEAALGIAYVDEDTLFRRSDFVVVLLPYSQETDLKIDRRVFECMKPGAYIVGCGSGSVIHEAHLAAALRSGHLAGAALDTFEWEPIRGGNPLIALARAGANVLLTPHIAAAGNDASAIDLRRADYTNILRHLQGRPLLYRVG